MIYVVALGLGACNCGEASAPKMHPLDSPTPAVSPSLSLAARCADLLSPKDIEKTCGTKAYIGTSKDEWDCELLFLSTVDDKSQLKVSVVNELSPEQAMHRHGRLAKQSQRFKEFEEVANMGDASHTFYRTYGKADTFRRMHVMDTAKGTYVMRLRAPYPKDVEPVCSAEHLPQLTKLLSERLAKGEAAPK